MLLSGNSAIEVAAVGDSGLLGWVSSNVDSIGVGVVNMDDGDTRGVYWAAWAGWLSVMT